MRIKITKRSGHNVYGEGGMYGKLKYGFEKLGHEVVEDCEELLIVPGTSADLAELETFNDVKKIWWTHGVNWARGFENEDLTVFKNNYDNCDVIVYQSEFAKHMVEKAFGPKDGPIIWNASIPDIPEKFIEYKEGEEIKLVACSVWRAWKRLHEIERLVRLMAAKGHKINLRVIGKDPADGCPFQEPKEGENYKIEYMGMMNLEQMKPIYNDSHIGVHLAFNDYSPASVTEMMASGLPVIVTDSGGSKDIVQNKGGLVIETDPFVDTSFNIHREDVLPKVDNQRFVLTLFTMISNLSEYQQRNKVWVEQEANCIFQAEKFLSL